MLRLFGGAGRVALLACLAVALAPPAWSATSTTTFQVTANVQATCLISATNLNFGAYTGTQIAATSTITITCTNNQSYDIGLDAGMSGGTVTTRKMTGPGGAVLGYGLYRDTNHTTNWGNTVGTDTEHGVGNGSAQTLSVYGLLPAGQYVMPGAYVDTITATITY